jgi:hypothetical protein
MGVVGDASRAGKLLRTIWVGLALKCENCGLHAHCTKSRRAPRSITAQESFVGMPVSIERPKNAHDWRSRHCRRAHTHTLRGSNAPTYCTAQRSGGPGNLQLVLVAKRLCVIDVPVVPWDLANKTAQPGLTSICQSQSARAIVFIKKKCDDADAAHCCQNSHNSILKRNLSRRCIFCGLRVG